MKHKHKYKHRHLSSHANTTNTTGSRPQTLHSLSHRYYKHDRDPVSYRFTYRGRVPVTDIYYKHDRGPVCHRFTDRAEYQSQIDITKMIEIQSVTYRFKLSVTGRIQSRIQSFTDRNNIPVTDKYSKSDRKSVCNI